MGIFLNSSLTCLLRQGLSLNQQHPQKAKWLASKSQRSSCLLFSSARITGVWHHAQHFICVLGNQVCVLMLIQQAIYSLSQFPYQKHDYFQAKTVFENSFRDISSSLKDSLVLKLLTKTHQMSVTIFVSTRHGTG